MDSHLLLAAFFSSFSDSVCTERESSFQSLVQERSCGRLNELLNPSSFCWQSLYRERAPCCYSAPVVPILLSPIDPCVLQLPLFLFPPPVFAYLPCESFCWRQLYTFALPWQLQPNLSLIDSSFPSSSHPLLLFFPPPPPVYLLLFYFFIFHDFVFFLVRLSSLFMYKRVGKKWDHLSPSVARPSGLSIRSQASGEAQEWILWPHTAHSIYTQRSQSKQFFLPFFVPPPCS